MSILIVDDSEDMRSSLKCVLEMEGFHGVITADSAQAAFELLGMEESGCSPRDVDVVLMDITMPEIDGLEACRRIKEHPELADIPVLVVTGRTEEKDLAIAFAAGATDYIRKPIHPVELVARLRSALALKHELDCRRTREQELVAVTHQLQEANQALQRISNIDALTGVANRRHFSIVLAREWGRAVRDGHPLAAVMIDVDFFKAYNDAYGHLRGDDCLRQVALALQATIKRPADLLARYGGEEFVILLPKTGLPGAIALAEEARRRVEGAEDRPPAFLHSAPRYRQPRRGLDVGGPARRAGSPDKRRRPGPIRSQAGGTQPRLPFQRCARPIPRPKPRPDQVRKPSHPFRKFVLR